jgi:fumarylacetoacetase
VLRGLAAQALALCAKPALNAFMAAGHEASAALRAALSEALRAGSPLAAGLRPLLIPQSAAEYRVAAQVGDFTDFYASIHHATAVGRLFRPDNPLLPNYKWVPIAYHGRASSVLVSGQSFARPYGQVLPAGATQPELAASRRLDYELEVGVFIGRGNRLGHRVPLAQAESHVFGLCLLNDWSARDVQAWEYQPLGPFLAKNFATTVSPWVVTLEALAPFRVPWTRPAGEPAPSTYSSKRGSTPRACARPVCRRSGCRTARSATRGGRSRRCSRTTPSTAATSSPATCSAAVRSRVLSHPKPAHSSSSAPVGGSRSHSPAARRAPSSRTAIG